MFKFLGKTENSLAFRKYDGDNYMDYGVFDSNTLMNQPEIEAYFLAIEGLSSEERDLIPDIVPIYEIKLNYTNFFSGLQAYDGLNFDLACDSYLKSLENT